jgi:ribonucleoside-triphosphate reductase (thioredoxin)
MHTVTLKNELYRQYIAITLICTFCDRAEQLPVVADRFEESSTPVYVADSREGWASALRELVLSLYCGKIQKFDTRDVRPAGSILKTFGGIASGPEPLHGLQSFFVSLFRNAAGRRLTPLECHDCICHIADIVVVGGVRRCASCHVGCFS